MIIITAPAHPYLADTLREKGFEVMYAPSISYQELSEIIADSTGLVVTTRLKIDKPMLEKALKLEWIGRLGSGLELIDIRFAESRNIKCFSTPEGNRNAVAEHALGSLLSLTKNISKSQYEVKQGKWIRDKNRGTELSGKTAGIIGFGNTGQAFIKLLSAFDIPILVYDKYKFDFGSSLVREVNLEQLCRYADVISFHVPLTEETMHMADEHFFNSLGKQPYIINTSRGKVVKTAALIDALKHKKIAGAALDVLENEQISNLTASQKQEFDYLVAAENVLVTPHIAGYSDEAFYKMSRILIEKLGI